VCVAALEALVVDVAGWLVAPSRRLPTGITLGGLTGDDLVTYVDDAEAALGGFAALGSDPHAPTSARLLRSCVGKNP